MRTTFSKLISKTALLIHKTQDWTLSHHIFIFDLNMHILILLSFMHFYYFPNLMCVFFSIYLSERDTYIEYRERLTSLADKMLLALPHIHIYMKNFNIILLWAICSSRKAKIQKFQKICMNDDSFLVIIIIIKVHRIDGVLFDIFFAMCTFILHMICVSVCLVQIYIYPIFIQLIPYFFPKIGQYLIFLVHV